MIFNGELNPVSGSIRLPGVFQYNLHLWLGCSATVNYGVQDKKSRYFSRSHPEVPMTDFYKILIMTAIKEPHHGVISREAITL